MPEFTPETFQPPWWLRGGRAQTLWAALARLGGQLPMRRIRIDTPDGDFLDLDFPHTAAARALPDDAPVVLMLHGLGGSARSTYAMTLYRLLLAGGMRPVGMNYRSASGHLNRTARLYHAGATDDAALVRAWLIDRYPRASFGVVGFSLGANLALKYLGEGGEALRERLAAAAVVSPPFDLAAGARQIDRDWFGQLFVWRMLPHIRRVVRGKAAELNGHVDLNAALRARTIWAFDDTFTAPLHGFADAADYYARNSAGRFWRAIRVPTLLIRATDDPLFDPADIPTDLASNPAIAPLISPRGGHVAFYAGLRGGWWAEQQVVRFLAAQFAIPPR